MTELTLELTGETARQFEFLLDQTTVREGGDERDADPEELAEQLLTDAVLEAYIETVRS